MTDIEIAVGDLEADLLAKVMMQAFRRIGQLGPEAVNALTAAVDAETKDPWIVDGLCQVEFILADHNDAA